MTLIAVSRIVHGQGDKGEKIFNIGDPVSGLSEAEELSLVAAGAVVETGKHKYTQPGTAVVTDEETRKRDEILAKAAAGQDLSPAVLSALASGSPDASAESPTPTTGGTTPPSIGASNVPEGGAKTGDSGAIEGTKSEKK